MITMIMGIVMFTFIILTLVWVVVDDAEELVQGNVLGWLAARGVAVRVVEIQVVDLHAPQRIQLARVVPAVCV